ncbi:acyl-CoA dehydrogenase [uncultured Streptomyces sp.]|uniref:acyl-CoA dehydrogenase n=1 Tax=uncultured Streptomyces sp. TaxID=174707 RepID=UPI00260CDBBA|nr:acyl-CoA dehydrogenase [uncultured Streptomyces sp.]
MSDTTVAGVRQGPGAGGEGIDPASGTGPAAVRADAAAGFAAVVERIDAGELRFPLPGAGSTAARFDALSRVAEQDVCVARLVEGHVDAVAILAELDGPPPAPGSRWGVWAAEPPGEGLTFARSGGSWSVTGLKRYCSGAHSCTHALVTAEAEGERRLFAVAVDGPSVTPVAGTWQAVGMAGSDTPDVRFRATPAVPVGAPGAYVHRPGFEHGGVGVAACWYGGAVGVARALRAAAARRPEPHTDAHLGSVDMLLHAASAVLTEAAGEIDRDPLDKEEGARLRAMRVRAFVEHVCDEVLRHVGRATGAGPLCHDPRHARAAADLAVYVRQHHAERDLAALGAAVARPGEDA